MSYRHVEGGEKRPPNCRFRLQDEGKAYPRSSCAACGKTVTTGLGKGCTFATPPSRNDTIRVTDAMVEAALNRWDERPFKMIGHTDFEAMRDAILAALKVQS